ncbi:MAG TPA: hypothetical protein VKT32_10680, partial [Chthonomonadaceae bacterium]|nr:hypothetical protein [Chthonomonadaceae bacterium]
MSVWSDAFWGALNATIDSRTPTDGSGNPIAGEAWTKATGTGAIVLSGSHTAEINNGSSAAPCLYVANDSPGTTDYAVQAVFTWPSITRGVYGLALRCDYYLSTVWQFYALAYNATTGQWQFWVQNGQGIHTGQPLVLAAIANTLDLTTTHTIKFVAAGQRPTVLSMTVDGSSTAYFQYTDAAVIQPTIAGSVGLFGWNSGGTTYSAQLGSFTDGTTTQSAVSVTVTPSSVQLYQGQGQQFAAIVSNTSDQTGT